MAFNQLKNLVAKIREMKEAAAVAVEISAQKIVNELKEEGPYYTGYFHDSWEIKLDRKKGAAAKTTVAYITNTASYAPIAMDLVPGRGKGEDGQAVMPPNTAPQDWYITYAAGGQLDKSVQITADDFLLQTWRRGL
jgi:hypothetical protein